MPILTRIEITRAMAEDAEAPEALPEAVPACRDCGGPLVDCNGVALPAPPIRGRMPLRARIAHLRAFLCCACYGCDICCAA